MTIDTLITIKKIAKRLAPAQRVEHIAALEIVARELGQAHWRGFSGAHKLVATHTGADGKPAGTTDEVLRRCIPQGTETKRPRSALWVMV